MNTVKKENLTENLFLAGMVFVIAYISSDHAAVFNFYAIMGMFVLHYRLYKDGLWGAETNKVLFGITGILVMSTLVIFTLNSGGFDEAIEQAKRGHMTENWRLGLVIFAYSVPHFLTALLPFFGVKLAIEKIKEKQG